MVVLHNVISRTYQFFPCNETYIPIHVTTANHICPSFISFEEASQYNRVACRKRMFRAISTLTLMDSSQKIFYNRLASDLQPSARAQKSVPDWQGFLKYYNIAWHWPHYCKWRACLHGGRSELAVNGNLTVNIRDAETKTSGSLNSGNISSELKSFWR